jgi:hypothetical protein
MLRRRQDLELTGAYVSYLGADATAEAVRSAYTRLVALKDRYDPTNFFRLNQNIRPTTP